MTTVSPSHASRRALAGIAFAIVVALGGCASIPRDMVSGAPDIEVPSYWNETALDGQDVVTETWWRDFGDPVLDGLVEAALEANRDLRVAMARLAQARALADGAASERRPRMDAVAGGQRGRESAADPRAERSAVGLRAAWELDLFGHEALAVAAAEADADSVHRALEAARIALAADVASHYFELRTLERRLALKRDAIELAQRQVEVASRKFEAGQATSLDQERWRAELAQERALMAQLDAERRVRLHQLSLLLGDGRVPELAAQTVPDTVPAPPASLLPAELLERRPDVQGQARALDAALARAGVARREVYPRLQIAWAGSQERLAVSGESASPRLVVGYGVSLSLPVLDGGRIRANIAVRDAQAQEAMAEYEKAMLVALVDVETGFTQWQASGASLQEWQHAETAGEVAARNAQRLYEAGVTDLSAVLDARQSHLRARDALTQAMGERWEAAVGLRRAFAGAL